MKSRKKKTLPVRAKRYQKKRDNQKLDYSNLEPRQLLAADFLPTVNYVDSTDLINLTNPVPQSEGVEILRSHLNMGQNESLALKDSFADQYGYEHFKYQQFYNNVLVQGSNYTLHVKDSMIVSMSGDRVELVSPVVGSQITSDQAMATAMDHIGSENYAWQDKFHSELLGLRNGPDFEQVYITGDHGQSILAYKFDMYAIDLGTRDYVYVNANTGLVEAVETRIRNEDVAAEGESHYNGIVPFIADRVSDSEYRLRQVTDGVETYDNQMNPYADFSDAIDHTANSPLFDSPVHFSGVSAHWGAENTLAMYSSMFGRDSYDDQGSTLISYVNVEEEWNNATWNGSVMQYGEGDGVTFGPLVEIDIVGHEITHGVTEYSANLVYSYEPGALNESFSDIFGEMVENFATGTNDWMTGVSAYLAGTNGLRSFIDPNLENQPDTYLGDMWWTSPFDNGGVHFNSGVQNKWFYILSEGEVGTNDNGEDYDVTGIGIEDAARIAYRNLTVYLGVNSQFQDARNGAVQAAIDIFGANSPQHVATSAAWAAVGVYSEDVIIDSVSEVVPGSMIFATEARGSVDPGEPRDVRIELDENQTLSVLVEGKAGVVPSFTIEDPDGTIIATADASGTRTMLNSVPIKLAGEYLIHVSSETSSGDFEILVVLNSSLEEEIVQSFDNGELSTAQNIESSVLDLSEISADRLGVFGQFDISEIPSFTGEDFESGILDSGSWTTTSSSAEGRIRVIESFSSGEGDFALFMDTNANGFENLNEAIWTVDTSSIASSAFLNFYHASFNDENAILPASFNGTYEGDGVSVSDDGITWHTILTDSVTDAGDWHQFSVNLGNLATNVGLDLSSNLMVKFQQFDDDRLGADGRAYDGISITATDRSEDWYSFDLNAGESASIAVGRTVLQGFVELELYDSGGELIETGTPSVNASSRITQFVADETDTYFARLVGSSTPYGLVVTRGADFDIGASDAAPQDLTLPGSVIGSIDSVARGDADPDAASDGQLLDNYFDGVTLSNNITGGSVYAVLAQSFEAPSGIHVFGPTPTAASGWQGGVDELRADFAIPQTYVSLLVGAEESATDVGFLRAFDIHGNEIDEIVSRPLEPGETQRLFVTSPSRQIAYIVAGGFQNDVTPLDDLSYEVASEDFDYYSINAAAGEFVTVAASFPGAGPFLFENGLVNGSEVQLRMEIVNPAGQLVATGSDDVTFYSVDGGAFMIRVSAVAGSGNYQLGITNESDPGGTGLGNLGFGVAVDDAATGKGYLMYSADNVFDRFASNPPLAGNAEHVVAVQYNRVSQTWQYNNDQAWVDFTIASEDRLLAMVDFDADTIHSLGGLSGDVYGVPQGFGRGDLAFSANMWNSVVDSGEFGVMGSYFFADDDGNDATMSIGDTGMGIGVHDAATGTGFIMYSEEDVFTRFAADAPLAGGALQMVAVRSNAGNWQYSNNLGWVDFTPVATDRLIAAVDFSNDTVTGIEGQGGDIDGIHQGFFDSDLIFAANMWDGGSDTGEFEVTGTRFKTSGFSQSIPFMEGGVLGIDTASGSGYIMYSEQSVHKRFDGIAQFPKAGAFMIVVRLNGSTWEFSSDTDWIAFTPRESDRLMATIDFDADTVFSLEGTGGNLNGIDSGFFDSDLEFAANMFGGNFNDGEFGISGTSFIA